jgi:hypothetical protein
VDDYVTRTGIHACPEQVSEPSSSWADEAATTLSAWWSSPS